MARRAADHRLRAEGADEGAPPTDRMEVRFVYDDDALYVGARMFSDAPIQAPMGRRDDGEQAEHLLVSLDTYLDRRTASTFGVTATGVRLDHLLRERRRVGQRRQVRPGVAGAHEHRRAGLDGGAVDPVLAAALHRAESAGLGTEHPALGPVAQRGGVLVARCAHRGALGVALRRPARHRRHRPEPPARADAVRGELVASDRRSRSQTIRSPAAAISKGASART